MDGPPPAPSAAPSATSRAPILLLVCVPVVVIAIAVSTLLLGQTSHARPSGSAQGVVEAATEYYTLAGIDTGALYFTATVSKVDGHWARFEASAVGPGAGPTTFGYATFVGHRWVVVAHGTALAGCPSPGHPHGAVPAPVLTGFGIDCPPAG